MSHTADGRPEEMASFFDQRADGYEDHMNTYTYTEIVMKEYYALVASPIPETATPIHILDLGCGTGLELHHIFKKVPHAVITCIDMSENMLAKLKQIYAGYAHQLEIVQGSYVDIPLPANHYDYAISVMTMHHLLETPKRDLYQKIRAALTNHGCYIEGDYVVDEAHEHQYLKKYHDHMSLANPGEMYHIDIPFSKQTQTRIFLDAGFTEVNTLYHGKEKAIFVVQE